MRRIRWLAAFVIGTTGVMPTATAQDAPPAAKTSPEKVAVDELQKATDTFATDVQERQEFDDAAKDFITKVALQKLRQPPQQRRLVGFEKLEAALDRIRETLNGPKGADAGASQKIRAAAAAWLEEQARSGDTVVAANAALLLGDLRVDGKPWIEGSKRLAGLAAAADLKPAVRAAALAGLARHADDLASKQPAPPEFAEAVTPTLVAIITSSTANADPSARWLVSRTLDLVAKVERTASPELATALAAVMADPARTTDERVRAAIALGCTATRESGIDAAQAVVAARRLAEDALADSLATAKDRALAASLSGMPVPMLQQPGLPEAAPVTPAYPLNNVEVQRDAWRLLKLSEAIARPKLKKDKSGQLRPSWGESPEGGLVQLLDDKAKADAVALATQLRTEAEALVANPTASRVAEARETIATDIPVGQ